MGFKEWFDKMAAEGAELQAEKAGRKEPKVRRVRLNMNLKREVKRLAKFRDEGWSITSEKRDKQLLTGQDTGWVTYMLTRSE